MKVVSASKGSKTLLLLVVIIGLMLASAVAKGGGGFRGGRAAGTGGLIGGGTATTTTGGKTSASVTWGPTSTFWLLLTSFTFLMIRQLAQEIKELSLSSPVTIYNGNSVSNGNFSSYLVPAAALGAMGYCYIWWKGWSFSDVMFVTKQNMANAVATVSKQLENVSETLASTKRHLTKRLGNLDWKIEEQIETSKLIANDVDEMKSNLSQIGYDVESIHEMISGLKGKLELLESKQDATNSGLWYLCQFAGGLKDGLGTKAYQDVGAKLANHSAMAYEERCPKGLQFIAETKESDMVEKPVENEKKNDLDTFSGEKAARTLKIHRSYPGGLSLTRDILGSGI